MNKETKIDGIKEDRMQKQRVKERSRQKHMKRPQERKKKEKQAKNGTMIQNVAKLF
jgi:hypothetical protein